MVFTAHVRTTYVHINYRKHYCACQETSNIFKKYILLRMYGLEDGLWYTESLDLSERRLNGLVHLFHLKPWLRGRLSTVLNHGVFCTCQNNLCTYSIIENITAHVRLLYFCCNCACHIFVQNHQSAMHIF